MNFGDFAIGAAEGIDRGVRTAGAIEDIWAKKADSLHRQEMQGLQLNQARDTEQKRLEQDKLDNSPLDWKKPLLENIPDPKMREEVMASLSPFSDTVKGSQQGQQFLANNLKGFEIIKVVSNEGHDRAARELLSRVDGLQKQLASTPQGSQDYAKLTAEIAETNKAIDEVQMAKKGVDAQILKAQHSKILGEMTNLSKEERNRLEGFAGTENFYQQMYNPNDAKSLEVITAAAAAGSNDAKKALELLTGAKSAIKAAGEAGGKILPPAQANLIRKELDRFIRSSYTLTPDIEQAIKRNDTMATGGSRDAALSLSREQQALFNSVALRAGQLLTDRVTTTAAEAVQLALRERGLLGTGGQPAPAPTAQPKPPLSEVNRLKKMGKDLQVDDRGRYWELDMATGQRTPYQNTPGNAPAAAPSQQPATKQPKEAIHITQEAPTGTGIQPTSQKRSDPFEQRKNAMKMEDARRNAPRDKAQAEKLQGQLSEFERNKEQTIAALIAKRERALLNMQGVLTAEAKASAAELGKREYQRTVDELRNEIDRLLQYQPEVLASR